MIHSTKNRATIVKLLALGLLLATLLAMALASAPAGAAVTSGKAFAWGNNSEGQLGNGTSGQGTDTNTPAGVSNLSGIKSVKAGCDHSLALKENGTVWAWGTNRYGQLGNGTSGDGTHKTTPVRVANLSGVEAVTAGGRHSLALLGSGTVKSWGHNYHGQLGNGTNGDGTDRSTPENVLGLKNVRSISGGAFHSLAILESGAARSWGHNGNGQLGNGAFGGEYDVPVAVKNLTNIMNIDGGFAHTLALTQ